MIYKRTPSSMNKYNFTAVRYHVDAHKLLRIAQHKMSQKTFHCSSIRSITHSSQSQSWDSENAQHNLEIAQILRLHGTILLVSFS